MGSSFSGVMQKIWAENPWLNVKFFINGGLTLSSRKFWPLPIEDD